MLESLLSAGMDVARLNFSHGTHQAHAHVICTLRELSLKMGKPLALLQDLSGPKVRLGTFMTPSVMLRRGQIVGFVASETSGDGASAGYHTAFDAAGTAAPGCLLLPLPVPQMLDALTPGRQLLLDDGKIALKVTACAGAPGSPERTVWARVIVGGELKPHKGVAAPGVVFDVPAVTEKDIDDLRFGLAHGVDWVAASYVRYADDLEPLRAVMREVGITVPLIAKIEKFEAVENLESILDACDGAMVARGDLGVEMPVEEVAVTQKRIIRACNRKGKPVITATQMLDSMIRNPRPTRAEVTDITNAVFDGTDAVMLSGETAAGAYPMEAVQMMSRIAEFAEGAIDYAHVLDEKHLEHGARASVTDAIGEAVATIATEQHAQAILCSTTSGNTARTVSKFRPQTRILAATTEETTYRAMALYWGVEPMLVPFPRDTDAMIAQTVEAATRFGHVHDGDRVVITAGTPLGVPGSTNLIKVHIIGQPLTTPPAP